MAKFVPRYTFWEGLNIAIHLAMQAIDEIRALARIPGPAGKDGRDGLSIEDLNLDSREDGVFLRFERGDIKKEWRLPVVVDRGVWREKQYGPGDGVTWGGSFWIAQRDTADKPDNGNGSWRLAVKKGRDGKDGGSTPAAPRGPIKVG